MTGYGEAEYGFRIPHDGWYELWIESCSWSTDLLLDGRLLTHTTFTSGQWKPDHGAEKVLNLYLATGEHTLRFVRPWPPGLPYLRRFFLEPARDATGMVRLAPKKDCMVFRRGEQFPHAVAGGATGGGLRHPSGPGRSGDGPHRPAMDRAGAGRRRPVEHHHRHRYRLRRGVRPARPRRRGAAHGSDRAIRRDRHPHLAGRNRPAKLHKELVQEIDCAGQKPDYSTSPTRVIRAVRRAYRESGTRGRFGQQLQADSFAYTLKLPSIQEPYLAEIDYPDDDQRTFSIALIERAANPYAPTQGVASGGVYSLSGQMQPHELFFYPREEQPRLLVSELVSGPAGRGGADPRLSHHRRLAAVCDRRPAAAPSACGRRSRCA